MSHFKLPDLGEGLPDAEIHEWFVKVGDTVTADQPLVAMETAKAIVEVPSPQSGVIKKLHGKPGDIIDVGAVLVEYEVAYEVEYESIAATPTHTVSADSGTVVGKLDTSGEILEEAATGIPQHKHAESVDTSGASNSTAMAANKTIKATPAVRALAKQLKLELADIRPTGPGGSISLNDVTQASTQMSRTSTSQSLQTDPASHTSTSCSNTAHANIPSPIPTGFQPLQGARRRMASVMSKAHAEVVPITLVDRADLYRWPSKKNMTVNIIQALIAACRAEPQLNIAFDGKTQSQKLQGHINLGIAVDTQHGLYVPVIHNTDTLSAAQLREKLNEFKSKATNNQFTPADLQGASITLSNFGTLAGEFATPIVVPPTVAILGIGTLKDQVVAVDGEVVVHPMLPLSLTVDHRAVTGGEAARFLAEFIRALSGMGTRKGCPYD